MESIKSHPGRYRCEAGLILGLPGLAHTQFAIVIRRLKTSGHPAIKALHMGRGSCCLPNYSQNTCKRKSFKLCVASGHEHNQQRWARPPTHSLPRGLPCLTTVFIPQTIHILKGPLVCTCVNHCTSLILDGNWHVRSSKFEQISPGAR